MKKEIKGYERYLIDENGNVYNRAGQIIKARLSNNGYLRVGLRTGKIKYEKPKTCSVHRLVAEHLLLCTIERGQVNHKDGNKLNNNVENLEWVNGSENITHAIKNGLLKLHPEKMHTDEAKAKSKRSHHTEEDANKMRKINNAVGNTVPIVQKDFDGNTIKIYENCAAAARTLFGTEVKNESFLISRCARGKVKSAYGYTWCYGQEVAL